MIYKDGRPIMRSSTGASESEIRAIVESSNESLAERILAMIAGMPARTVIAGAEQETFDKFDSDSIRRLAAEMASAGTIKESNFESLGKECKVENDADDVVGLLKDIKV